VAKSIELSSVLSSFCQAVELPAAKRHQPNSGTARPGKPRLPTSFPVSLRLLLCRSRAAVTQNLQVFQQSTRLLTPLPSPPGRGGRHSPPASSAGPGNSWSQDEFIDKCSRMVDQVRHSLGPSAPIFDRPVDGRLVPDYYNVIKKPMDLGTLKQRLHEGYYSTPQQFAEVSKSAVCLACVLTFCYSV